MAENTVEMLLENLTNNKSKNPPDELTPTVNTETTKQFKKL